MLGEHEVCTNDYASSRFGRTVYKHAATIPDGGVQEIADTTKHNHQCVHIVVGYVKITACSEMLQPFCGLQDRGGSRNDMRYAHVMEEPLSFFWVIGKIAGHHQLIGDHVGGVTYYIEEAVDILGLSAFPRAICGVAWCGVIVTRGKRVQLLQKPVIRVDLRSPIPEVPDGPGRGQFTGFHQICTNDSCTTGNAHDTMDQNLPTDINGVLDEATSDG